MKKGKALIGLLLLLQPVKSKVVVCTRREQFTSPEQHFITFRFYGENQVVVNYKEGYLLQNSSVVHILQSYSPYSQLFQSWSQNCSNIPVPKQVFSEVPDFHGKEWCQHDLSAMAATTFTVRTNPLVDTTCAWVADDSSILTIIRVVYDLKSAFCDAIGLTPQSCRSIVNSILESSKCS